MRKIEQFLLTILRIDLNVIFLLQATKNLKSRIYSIANDKS